MATTDASPRPRPSGGRGLFLAGLALALLGVALVVIQFGLGRLAAPWYLPALTLIGGALVAASVWRRRTVGGVIALVVLVGLGGLEWAALNAMRLPPYAGPVAVGQPFPAFEARLADGSAFTQASLVGESDSALVFFRGRW